jgi:hypothetical protein
MTHHTQELVNSSDVMQVVHGGGRIEEWLVGGDQQPGRAAGVTTAVESKSDGEKAT